MAAKGRGVIIRQYQPADEEAIRRICADTAYLGDPIEKTVFPDREAVSDLIVKPYLKYEPSHALVAEIHGQVAGYLTGAISSSFKRKEVMSQAKTTLVMLGRWIIGKYASYPRGGTYVKRLVTRAAKEDPKHPLAPTHFHMNVSPQYQGLGIGKQLVTEFEKILKRNGIGEYWCVSIVPPEGGNSVFYTHLGFTPFDEKPVTWLGDDSKPLRAICFRKILEKPLSKKPAREKQTLLEESLRPANA